MDDTGEERKSSADGGEAAPQISSSSLFPLFAASNRAPAISDGRLETPRWLSNTSFTAEVSIASHSAGDAAETSFRVAYVGEEEEEEEDEKARAAKPAEYELVGSSSPSSEERRSEEAGETIKKKKKKRRRGIKERRRGDGDSRRAKVRAWASAQSGKQVKDHFIDTRGDPDNLEYGSIYRMNVARYKIYNLRETPNFHLKSLYRRKPQDSYLDSENDLDILDSKSKVAGRYCSSKYSAWERHKGFKRLKIVSNERFSGSPPEFISLVDLKVSSEGNDFEMDIEESWEDEMIRRTREFNKKTRDSPHDARVWMEFADFQDQIAKRQPQKAARLQTLEKKISILEKAIELNSENEELLLSLLNAYQKRETGDALIEKWVKILIHHSSSYKLWMEFLHVRQSDFSRFKVSDVRKTYAHAIQALSSASSKLSRQGDPNQVKVEFALVDVFIGLCRFEWQSGYRELATGLLQAEIEFSLFCPSLLLSMQNKYRLFEHFWNSGGPRVGEEEALGWSSWMEKEEENRVNVAEEEAATKEEAEAGGWSGWYEPSMKDEASIKGFDDEDVDDDEDDGDDGRSEEVEDDVETLLRKLGIDADAEPQSEVNDSTTWNRWSKEECSRESEQWMPVREDSGAGQLGEEQLSRVIMFEDIRDYLFSLYSEEARFRLVSRFIDFYGGKISQWECTNSASWIEDALSLDATPNSILNCLMMILEDEAEEPRIRAEIMRFVRNAILLCVSSFPRNHVLEEALLLAEEQSVTRKSGSISSETPSRSLAKWLLKNDRQDFVLCGVYARREAAHGNADLARKVFDMALSSISGLPPDLQTSSPLIYLWYADMETTEYISSGSEISRKRAVHVLSHLGSGEKYEVFKGQPSSPMLLRARQGFKEQIRSLRSSWTRGDVNDEAVALLCAAFLFEILTSGMTAAEEIVEEALSMVLPERRAQSLQIESLTTYYTEILQKHCRRLNLSGVWKNIKRWLETYPNNPRISSAMIEISNFFTVQHRIRRTLDELCHRNPSVIVVLFAVSYELERDGTQHRIRRIFERALSNDRLQRSVLLWRSYLAYEIQTARNPNMGRRVFYRAIHSCPWSKALWLDGFQKLSGVLSAKELADLQEVMRDKELNLRTDIYEILLQDEI